MSESYSNLRIFKHPEKLENLINGEITAPIMARIKPTNVCDQFCFYCSTPVKATYVKDAEDEFKFKDSIPWDILERTINELADIGVKSIILSGGGEPLVYPKIQDAIKLIYKNNMDLAIITNGWKLNGDKAKLLAKAKWVRISLGSSDAKRYCEMRGIPKDSFNTICNNIKEFNKIREGKLGINYVVHKKNYDMIYDTAILFKHLGIDNIKYAPIIHKDDPIGYHKDIRKKINIKKVDDELSDSNFKVIDKYENSLQSSMNFYREYDKCPIMQIVTSIAANCKVYFCHDKAYMRGNSLGDLKKNTFKEIWFSDKTKGIFDSFKAKETCKHHCVWDIRNKMILEYINTRKEEENFI